MQNQYETHTFKNISSIEACKSLSQHFLKLSKLAENQAKSLADLRKTQRKKCDLKDVVFCANRALVVAINGACPASECRKLSADFRLDYDHIFSLYQKKQRAHDRERIKTRNLLIHKWISKGVNYEIISKRTGISSAAISQIKASRL